MTTFQKRTAILFIFITLVLHISYISTIRRLDAKLEQKDAKIHTLIVNLNIVTSELMKNKSAVHTSLFDRINALEEFLGTDDKTTSSIFEHINYTLDYSDIDSLNNLVTLAKLRDSDSDGVVDAVDYCITLPRGMPPTTDEEGLTYSWTSGCPVADHDGDDVPDALDVCPNVTDIAVNKFVDVAAQFYGGIPVVTNDDRPALELAIKHYGCPDTDDDLIPDVVDLCIGETPDNDADLDGCDDNLRDLSNIGGYTLDQPAVPTYGAPGDGIVGYFRATRVVSNVTIKFALECQALGADGGQFPRGTENPVATKWGMCTATDLRNIPD